MAGPMETLLPALEEPLEQKSPSLPTRRTIPPAIGAFCKSRVCQDEYDLWVCEDLGGATERISKWSADTIQDEKFSPLNVVVLLKKTLPVKNDAFRHAEIPLLGIPDDQLAHGGERRGMITKREVRLLSLAYLQLQAGDTLWDVGAGSGSISIEAARLSPTLQAFAIEQSETAQKHVQENIAKFRLSKVKVIAGSAPDVFSALPNPDAVFIGGSGGRLEEILTQSVERLKPGGRLVMNCITIETFSRGWTMLERLGLDPRATNVQLSHSKPLANLHAMEPDSPIFILRGQKP